jgi:hypothetical protein
MSTIQSGLFKINGVISTDKSVMQNLNSLCTSAGCWMTYDIALGKWSVIINGTGTSVAAFNDNNIMGGINISGTGINELYNAVTIEFPHKDLRDQTDYIDLEIASADRYPNELDNRLNISLDSINDPIQAQYIATSELKQSRVDKIIEFRTDFTSLGLKAGDLIDITSEQYGYISKVFRILKMEEADEEGLVISITALEYDANVYDTTGLIRKERNKKTGIVPKDANEAITSSDAVNTTAQVATSLFDPSNSALISAFMASLTRNGGNPGLVPVVDIFQVNALVLTADDTTRTASLARTITLPYTGNYRVNYNINWGSNINPSPPLGMRKTSAIKIDIDGSNIALGDWASTGDSQVQVYEDHNLTGLFFGYAGESMSYSFIYRTNLSSGSYTTPAGYPSFTVPGDTLVAVWIICELAYTGA